MNDRFDYDLAKSHANLKKHDIDFEEAKKLWESTHVIIPVKNVMDENRFAILGKLRSKVYMGIYTERGSKTRLISCHRVDKKWENLYYEYLKKDKGK